MNGVVSFKTEDRILGLLENEAKKQYTSVSAVIRQILHKHFEGYPDVPTDEKVAPKATSREGRPSRKGAAVRPGATEGARP